MRRACSDTRTTLRERSGILWITSSREIGSLRRSGSFSRGRLVFAWVSRNANEGAEVARAGVITGRGFGKAVERNLARRRVRGCIVEMRHLLEPGNSYLVECRPGAQSANYQLLVSEISSILSRYSHCEMKTDQIDGGR